MTATRCVLVVALASLPMLALAQPPLPGGFDASDSTYVADETHTVTEVKEEARQGWREHVDSVRFGVYGFRVVQRLDPATGKPPPKQRWGDSFVGVAGKKPAFYMASNWSAWDFVVVNVRLKGDGQDLPQPTRLGLLATCGLREVTNARIVAEAAWDDEAGGLTRAEFVGWRGADRFGMRLSYTPPDGREVETLTYTLICQPYDYSDRGYWERRRYVMTPPGDAPLPDDPPLALDLAKTTQFVFHNRFAQNDSGTVLGVQRQSVQNMTAATAGNTVRTVLTPASVSAPVVLVLGDWVDEPYALAADRFFQAAADVAKELTEVAALQTALPPPPDAAEAAEMDSLLRTHPELAEQYGKQVQELRTELATARATLEQAGPNSPRAPRLLARYARARSGLAGRYNAVRGRWVELKAWQR